MNSIKIGLNLKDTAQFFLCYCVFPVIVQKGFSYKSWNFQPIPQKGQSPILCL